MENQVNYKQFTQQLIAAHVEFSGAEVHGLLCGLLCSGEEDASSQLFDELFQPGSEGDAEVRECCDALDQLYTTTQSAIEGDAIGYTLFLPDDDEALPQRARALCDWCQGFLYGVGMVGIADEGELSSVAREALQDLTEITKMELDGLGEDEEDESSLLEVIEYVWVAATLIREEVVSKSTDTGISSC
jgi:yecA family protein